MKYKLNLLNILSRLAHLEVNKLVTEKEDLEKDADRINEILNDEKLFNKLTDGWEEVAKKFDDRRTEILNLATEESEPIEVKSLLVNLTNKNNLIISEASSLYTQRWWRKQV